MFSFILFEGLKFNLFSSGIIYESCVFGFLPRRSGVFLKPKEPKPLNLTNLDLDYFLLIIRMIPICLLRLQQKLKIFCLYFLLYLSY